MVVARICCRLGHKSFRKLPQTLQGYNAWSRILGVLKLAVIDFKSLDIVNDEYGILAVAILADGKELWWLDNGECFQIAIISRKGVVLSRYAREYIEALKAHCM